MGGIFYSKWETNIGEIFLKVGGIFYSKWEINIGEIFLKWVEFFIQSGRQILVRDNSQFLFSLHMMGITLTVDSIDFGS